MNPLSTNTTPTMSSVELVGYINELREEGKAELLHKNFMVKIENHPGIDSAKFLAQYKDSTGRSLKCYHLPKRECELMVMSESLEVQTKVYDRMAALEQQLLQAPKAPRPQGNLEAFKLVPMVVRAARALGLDRNAAAISANQVVTKMTGTNVLNLLGHQHLEAENQSVMFFTPTELGERLGISGRKFNMLLAEAGLQAKKGEHWAPMATAEGFCRILDTGKRHGDGTMIQQVKWAENVLTLIEKAA